MYLYALRNQMFKLKNILFYVLTVGGLILLIYFTIQHGTKLESTQAISTVSDSSTFSHFKETMNHNMTDSFSLLLLQIITIIFVARTFGYIFNKLGQPTVIGEILAGIFLGPSIIGYWFPEFGTFMFPQDSINNLKLISQFGLVLFMFVIGMELDFKILKKQAQEAVIISHASIVIPYGLGVFLAYFLYKDYSSHTVPFLSFALFMGIAMSITAFPVLARILQERNLTKSPLGTIVITAAAADDITAWCLLAAVIAIVKAGSVISALYTIALAIAFVLIMIFVIRPFLKKVGEVYSNRESLSINIVAIFFGVLLISAYFAEVIGIHALFGAFMAGVMMPESMNFRKILIDKVESVSLGMLLPLFFVFTGLRTEIGLLSSGNLWGVCGIIILVAIIGKFIGSSIAAKIVGQDWKTSLSIGALMNTRGLMELVVLNIGYDLGVLSPEMFAMMVIMALVTTFMTGPSLDIINKVFKEKSSFISNVVQQHFRILLSFANPQGARKLARIASIISGNAKSNTEITALHVTPTSDLNQYQIAEYEKESFKPINLEAKKQGIKINNSYKTSNDVNEEILKDANSGDYNLLIVGFGQSVFQGTFLGQVIGATANILNPDKLLGSLTGRNIGGNTIFKTSKLFDEKSIQFIENSKIPVGLFVDHGLNQIEKICIPIVSISDVFLLFYVKKMIRSENIILSILDYNGIILSNPEIAEDLKSIKEINPAQYELVEKKNITHQYNQYDIIVLSIDGLKHMSNDISISDNEIPSLLLMRP